MRASAKPAWPLPQMSTHPNRKYLEQHVETYGRISFWGTLQTELDEARLSPIMLALGLAKLNRNLNDSMNSIPEPYPLANIGDPFKEQRYTGD